ncbi:hypothetical protein V6956_004604 [Vibrio parahaemolyticus]
MTVSPLVTDQLFDVVYVLVVLMGAVITNRNGQNPAHYRANDRSGRGNGNNHQDKRTGYR